MRWIEKFINEDQSVSNTIRIAFLPKISNQLFENIVAATDLICMTHIPGTVSSVLEVAPFLMNGALLCASGGSRLNQEW